jgi:hypothetical protein
MIVNFFNARGYDVLRLQWQLCLLVIQLASPALASRRWPAIYLLVHMRLRFKNHGPQYVPECLGGDTAYLSLVLQQQSPEHSCNCRSTSSPNKMLHMKSSTIAAPGVTFIARPNHRAFPILKSVCLSLCLRLNSAIITSDTSSKLG